MYIEKKVQTSINCDRIKVIQARLGEIFLTELILLNFTHFKVHKLWTKVNKFHYYDGDDPVSVGDRSEVKKFEKFCTSMISYYNCNLNPFA